MSDCCQSATSVFRGVPPRGLTPRRRAGRRNHPVGDRVEHLTSALAQLVWESGARRARRARIRPSAAARVVRVDRGHATLRAASGELRVVTNMPIAVGDGSSPTTRAGWQACSSAIAARAPHARRLRSSPVVAANVDIVVVANALDHAFSPRRLERFLLVAWESGAAPLVVLTKAEPTPTSPRAVAEARLGPRRTRTGAQRPHRAGRRRVRARLAGSTAVLLGRRGRARARS